MIIIGAVAAGTAAMCAVLAVRGASPIEGRLRSIGSSARGPMRVAGVVTDQRASWKITGALTGALVGCAAAALLSLGPLPVIATTYGGWVLPSIVAERRAARSRSHGERAVVTLVEFLHALVASGRPLESALASVGRRTGSSVLDTALSRALRDYVLGVPMHAALERHGQDLRLPGLVDLAARIERARDLGRGVLPLLVDLRDELRAQERARSLAAASQVEGKLTLVLTLCYLPALALLVIVPLFLTLLAGLFG